MASRRPNGGMPPTVRGYNFGEVTSALQKAIRRGLEDDALYWAVELDESGYGDYAWSRLMVITSEDVGLATPWMPAQIMALHHSWELMRKRRRGRPPRGRATSEGSERLPLIHAVLLCVRAKKSRIVDHANGWHTHLAEAGVRDREIPDVALDKHTYEGKKKGRGFEHFFDESSLIADPETGDLSTEPTLPDPYRDKARSVHVKAAKVVKA